MGNMMEMKVKKMKVERMNKKRNWCYPRFIRKTRTLPLKILLNSIRKDLTKMSKY
jgi:hypothetical protein